MKSSLTFILTLLAAFTFGQNGPTKQAESIVAEGKLLYKSEMASWYGTDLFLENYYDRENIGGYFSYSEGDTSKCIFFSDADKPVVIGTISFDSTFNVINARIDLTERDLTNTEKDLYQIRNIALTELQTNEDEFFEFYENTNPNIIPLISGKEKKVYILTGPIKSGIVILGNDYLLTFNRKNKLVAKKRLHNNIIPIEYGNVQEGVEVESAMHSHLPETGDFITATDICTLMLYSKFTTWKTHHVVSKKYLNIWNCESNTLIVIPMKTVEKIHEYDEKQEKKKRD